MTGRINIGSSSFFMDNIYSNLNDSLKYLVDKITTDHTEYTESILHNEDENFICSVSVIN
jgi:hypothetical protein